jgi:hypothetical protein
MVEFVRVTAGLAACTLQVTIGDGGDGTSAVGIMYVITPVSDEGERVAAARFGSEELLGSVRWWGPHSTTTCVPVNACAHRRRTDVSAQLPGLARTSLGETSSGRCDDPPPRGPRFPFGPPRLCLGTNCGAD